MVYLNKKVVDDTEEEFPFPSMPYTKADGTTGKIYQMPFRVFVRNGEIGLSYFKSRIAGPLSDALLAYLGINAQAVPLTPIRTKIDGVDGYQIDFDLYVAEEDLEFYDEYVDREGLGDVHDWFKETTGSVLSFLFEGRLEKIEKL